MEIKVEKLPVATACFFGFDPSFTKEREYDQKYLPGSYNRERKKKWFAQPISIKITIWLWPLQILWQYWATTELTGREHMKKEHQEHDEEAATDNASDGLSDRNPDIS